MEDCMKWWQESRFGMFIHFGISSASEGIWKGEDVPGLVEWMQCKREIPLAEYQTLAERLTLERFDAKRYVELARAAGMKYVVLTAKHHDGFAMYDSACSDYNVVRMCPGHRDVAREVAEEVRKAGLKMCFYYSQTLDWEDPDAFGNTWDFPEEKKVYRRFLDGKCKMQLKELLTEYGEIGLIWFDMPRGMTKEESRELKAYVKQFQPDCLVSGRINMDQTIGDYGSMGDNEFPSGKLVGSWETPATLNHAWGYRRSDHNWKTPEELLRLLIELLSKGMNYLLNIGPMPDGMVPEKSAEILREMGMWVKKNQEAVYGTQATPYEFDFPWGRISRKGRKLYLYLFEHMETLRLPGLENQIKRAYMITETGEAEVLFEIMEPEGHAVAVLSLPPSDNACYDVICLELDGEPKVKQGLYQLPDGEIHLYSHMASLHKSSEKQEKQEDKAGIDVEVLAEKGNRGAEDEFCIDPNGNIINWFEPENSAEWKFELYVPGEYEVWVQTRSAKYTPWVGGHTVALQCEDQVITHRLTEGEKVSNAHTRYFDERLTRLGSIQIQKPGMNQVSFHLTDCNREETAGLLVTKLMLKAENRIF